MGWARSLWLRRFLLGVNRRLCALPPVAVVSGNICHRHWLNKDIELDSMCGHAKPILEPHLEIGHRASNSVRESLATHEACGWMRLWSRGNDRKW